jgi:hypothetical protein
MPKSVVLHVPGLPPTDNHAYATVNRRRILSAAAEAWKSHVEAAWFEQADLSERRLLRGVLFECHLCFYMDLWTAAGEVRRWDGSSHQKLTVDALAKAIRSDDRNCLVLSLTKAERVVGRSSSTRVELVPRGPAQRG